MNLNINVDSFVTKLRNTVSNVAYQVNSSVNTLIPGNPVHRDYEILQTRCTYGCPGFIWHAHDAIKRDSASIKASLKDAIGKSSIIPVSESSSNLTAIPSTHPTNDEKQLYTVFLFDKSQLDSISNKAQRDICLDFIKKGVTQLTRLRHPSILTVDHPLEESRSSLAFVTEHVYGNLASILADDKPNSPALINKNLVDFDTNLGPKDGDYQSSSCKLDDVQIKAGLLQLCDGLRFLHNDARILHRNICLENIFVDSNNTWKLAGFEFCCQPTTKVVEQKPKLNSDIDGFFQNSSISSSETGETFFDSLKMIHLHESVPKNMIPNWSCSAPEHSNDSFVRTSSDIFSLGIMACALMAYINKKLSIHDLGLTYEDGLASDTYKRGIKIRELLDKLPANSKSQIIKYVNINVDSRPPLVSFNTLSLFQDVQVQAIRDLDSQFAWDRLKKIDFFNRLRDVLPKLSHQVKVNRVAKCLSSEMVNVDMIPHVLPNMLIISRDATPSEFKSKLFRNLRPAFRVLEPRSVPLMLLDNLEILFDRAQLCLSDAQVLVFGYINYLLDLDQSQQVHEKCLSTLPKVGRYIDDESMRKIILPKLANICNKSTNNQLRVSTLECMSKLVDRMDKWTYIETLLPILAAVPSLNSDIIMSIANIIKAGIDEIKLEIGNETIAKKILPFIIPLTIEKDLSGHQFQVIMALIRRLLDLLEKQSKFGKSNLYRVAT